MTGTKGNWLTAMKEVLRSPSPSRSFGMSLSPAPSQGPRQSLDNFLSRLGPGMLDTSFDLEERSSQPRRSSGRKSHEMDMSKGTKDHTKQMQSNNNSSHNISNNKNNSKASSKLHLQSNNNKRQLETQSNKPQEGGSVSNMKIKRGNNARGVNIELEHNDRHARAVAAASAAAVEAAAVAAQAAAEVMRLTQSGFASPYSGSRSPAMDELHLHNFFRVSHAATLIQSAYRGHLARQALRALKGLVKLQAVVRGHLVRRQARISLRCMQALVRLQARVRARQVKAALMLDEVDNHASKHSGDPQFRHTHYLKLHEMASRRHNLFIPTPNISARSPTGLMLHPTESMHTSYLPHPSHHNIRAMDTFSRASSVTSSDNAGDWDTSALSQEERELKAMKKQHAAAMRQNAASYTETHQRTPTRSSATPNRRISNDYYQPQPQRFSRLSFNETEPEKLHRDWSWLEGWMAAHGATSVWESNAAALWESRDERRERGDDEEEEYGYLYEDDEGEGLDDEEANARDSFNSLCHDHSNSDDDPAIKIIEMDRIATPRSSLAYPLHFISTSPSPTHHPFSTRPAQHFTSHVGSVHHQPLHHGQLTSGF